MRSPAPVTKVRAPCCGCLGGHAADLVQSTVGVPYTPQQRSAWSTAPMSATSARPSTPPPVTLPELAVPPHVFVLSLPATGRRTSSSTNGWSRRPSCPTRRCRTAIAGHREELLAILSAACGEPQVGEVAAFLSYRRVSTGFGGSGGPGGSGGSADGWTGRIGRDCLPGSWAEPRC